MVSGWPAGGAGSGVVVLDGDQAGRGLVVLVVVELVVVAVLVAVVEWTGTTVVGVGTSPA